VGKRPSRSLFVLICKCGWRAAEKLGIFDSSGKKVYKPLKAEEAVEFTIKKSNSGYPESGIKNDPVILNNVLMWLKKTIRSNKFFDVLNEPSLAFNVKNNSFDFWNMPTYILHRFQVSVDEEGKLCKQKIRQVWCFPHRIIAGEVVCFKEVFDNAKLKSLVDIFPTFATGLRGSEISDRIIGPIREAFALNYPCDEFIYSLDYSKYDRTIPLWAHDVFYALVGSCLDLDEKHSRLFDKIRFYNKYTPYIVNDEVHFAQRGISSGSYTTNVFDSWWNLTLIYMAQELVETKSSRTVDDIISGKISMFHNTTRLFRKAKTSQFFDDIKVSVCGDDAIIMAKPKLIHLHRAICEQFGMEVNHKKPAGLNDDTFFLGSYWNVQNEPYQTEFYLSAHCMFRNRFYKKGELPISIEEFKRSRICSICLKFVNGFDYMIKTFSEYGPIKRMFAEKLGYVKMRMFPEVSFEDVEFDYLTSWRYNY
jgi:hypothetical protein